jgi:hypothetical protein
MTFLRGTGLQPVRELLVAAKNRHRDELQTYSTATTFFPFFA